MRVSMIQEMQEVLPPPTYVFQKHGETVYVDKVEIDGKKVTRKRYVLTAGQQCTCMGFMKFGKCKHLRMLLGGQPDCRGVPALDAVREVSKVADVLRGKKVEVDDVDLPGMPDRIAQVVLTVKKSVSGLYKLVCLKKIEGAGELEIVVVFDEDSKTE